jgi:transcriptional regulator with XRE-family HTH domain
MTGINISILSQIERGLRVPTPRQRALFANLFGSEVEFLAGGNRNMSVPTMPEMKWNDDGTPNFGHLEATQEERPILAQLQTLVSDDYSYSVDTESGDFTKVRELYPDTVVYEVHQHGESTLYRRGYVVEDGRARLGDDVEHVPVEEFAILSRRRIARHGVPPMATGEDEG